MTDERLEFWTSGISLPTVAQRQAVAAEAAGWDGIVFPDSQNLTGDPFVAIALASQETSTLRFGTGVSNPVTRHPAALATLAASVNAASGGRFVLGIGRGDSALAHIGRAPVHVNKFDRYIRTLQTYLRGEEVPFSDLDDVEELPPLETLELANAPTASRISWLRNGDGKVPIDVTATGPRVIEIGAGNAEMLTLTVGADPERLVWAIELARKARADAGLDPTELVIGAYVNTACHPDRDVAQKLVSGALSTFARFSVMHGTATGPATADSLDVLSKLRQTYDMNQHASASSPQASAMPPEFIDRFSIAGPVEHCVRRLRELVGLGVERFICFGPSPQSLRAHPHEAAFSGRLLADEVLPEVRSR